MLLLPLVFVTTLGVYWGLGLSLSIWTATATYLAVVIIIALVQFGLVRPYFSFMKSALPDVTGWKRWVSTGLMLAPNRLLADRRKDLLLLISAVPLGAVGVAQMAVALSIVNFQNFTLVAIDTSFAPKLARSLSQGMKEESAPLDYRHATHFIAVSGALKMGMVMAGGVTLWLLMPIIIRLFGADYSASVDP